MRALPLPRRRVDRWRRDGGAAARVRGAPRHSTWSKVAEGRLDHDLRGAQHCSKSASARDGRSRSQHALDQRPRGHALSLDALRNVAPRRGRAGCATSSRSRCRTTASSSRSRRRTASTSAIRISSSAQPEEQKCELGIMIGDKTYWSQGLRHGCAPHAARVRLRRDEHEPRPAPRVRLQRARAGARTGRPASSRRAAAARRSTPRARTTT